MVVLSSKTIKEINEFNKKSTKIFNASGFQ